MIIASVEYGIFGYVLSTHSFSAATVTGLIAKIHLRTKELADELMASDAECGDLRCYTPAFADGYPSFDGFEPEFGENDWHGCLTSLVNSSIGEELEYNSKIHKEVRQGAILH